MSLLDHVDFDLYLTPAEFEGGSVAFPPQRFADRNDRLRALDALWRGDYSAYLTNQAVPVNVFADYSTRLADLMLMSEPGGVDIPVGAALYDAVIDISRFGGAILHWDGNLTVRSPLGWYPLHRDDGTGGDMWLATFVSDAAQSTQADRASAEVVWDTGESYTIVYQWSDGRLGAPIERTENDDAEVEVVAAEPTIGTLWGSSKYVRLCGAVVEMVRRLSKNSAVLDLFSGPTITYEATLDEARQQFRIPESDTPEEADRKIREALGEAFEGSIIRLDAECGLVRASYLQPSTGGVRDALSQVDTLRKFVADTTGLPDLSGMTQPPSGEALKRIFLAWYAESNRLLNRLREAVSMLIGAELQWVHVFDSIELNRAPATPAMPTIESRVVG